MHRYFESRLQRALAWYALVPVLIMALLGALLMLASWRYAVTGVNHESRELVADVLTGISNDLPNGLRWRQSFWAMYRTLRSGNMIWVCGRRPLGGSIMIPASGA